MDTKALTLLSLLASGCAAPTAIPDTGDVDSSAVDLAPGGDTTPETQDGAVDNDGDSYAGSADCDDLDPWSYPGARELCDGLDNDCDGFVDEAEDIAVVAWYQDQDQDGFGAGAPVEACNAPASGWTQEGSDCDDAQPLVHPDATEVCGGADDDCDGLLDADDPSLQGGAQAWVDTDGDGHGQEGSLAVAACPGDPGVAFVADDCDDTRSGVFPGALEVCDGLDNDCDGALDSADSGLSGGVGGFSDEDGDGYGASGSTAITICPDEEGFADNADDCDDADAAVSPAAEEICDDWTDNDCDSTMNACAVSGSISVDDVDLTYRGSTGDEVGGEAQVVGDLDADGYADLAILASGVVTDTDWRGDDVMGGVVYIVTDAFDSAGRLEDKAVARIVNIDISAGLDGARTAPAGDVNADGFDDLLIGAPGFYGTWIGGFVGLYYGPLEGEIDLYVDADAWWSTDPEFEREFGADVAAVGDIDEDGTVDIAIGSTSDDDRGNVHIVNASESGLVSSVQTALLLGAVDGDGFGAEVEAADVDGDGKRDLVVGAPLDAAGGSNSGAVYVFEARVSALVLATSADAIIVGESASQLGRSVRTVGDIDGDSRDDLLLGAPTAGTSQGAQYLVPGAAADGEVDVVDEAVAVVRGPAMSYVGYFAGSMGDMNGDAVPDLAVSASGYDGVSRLSVFYGPIEGDLDLDADAGFQLRGASWSDIVGAGTDLTQDIDADGRSDLVMGAPWVDEYGTNAGGTFVVLGHGW